jgi:hypothetical protein
MHGRPAALRTHGRPPSFAPRPSSFPLPSSLFPLRAQVLGTLLSAMSHANAEGNVQPPFAASASGARGSCGGGGGGGGGGGSQQRTQAGQGQSRRQQQRPGQEAHQKKSGSGKFGASGAGDVQVLLTFLLSFRTPPRCIQAQGPCCRPRCLHSPIRF